MIRHFLVILGLLVCLNAEAATKYISPTGSAAWGACTTDATPCSIATAQTSAAAGDVIILVDGTYSTGINTATNGSAGNLITWQAQNARQAVLNGLASGQTDKVLVVDNAYHKFDGIRINVQTGPGAANTYGLFVTGATYTEFVNGEITYTGDEQATGTGNIIYCAQLRSPTIFDGNYIHNCTYGVNVFSSTGGFAATVTNNTFADFIVGDYQDSDCMAVSGAASYDWTGTVFSENICSGWRDDGADFSSQTNVTFRDNVLHSPATDSGDGNSSCIKVGYEGSTGNKIQRNYCYDLNSATQDNYGLIMTGTSSAIVEANIISGAFEGATIAERNASGGDNNILRNNVLIATRDDGIQVGTGSTGTILQNNVFSGATRDINVLTGVTATGFNNRRVNATGNGDGTYNQTGDTDGAALFVGGTSPNSAEGFRLSASSPLRRVGLDLNLGNLQDNGNRAFSHPPSIGAWEIGSGDSITNNTRTTATTRTNRN